MTSQTSQSTIRKTPVHLYNRLCDEIGDHFQQVGGLSTLNVEGVNNELGDDVQVAGGDLQRQQRQHREPVEEVVYCGSCESPEHKVKRGTELRFVLSNIKL